MNLDTINEVMYSAVVVCGGILGFFVKRLVSDYDKLRRSFESERVHTAEELAKIRDGYVKYEEFVRFQVSIDSKLTKIYDILVER